MENCDTSAPLTKTNRELGVGDAVKFPIERHGSVKAVVSRLRLNRYTLAGMRELMLTMTIFK